jgi:CelD/BcsL family acetyltransferase involved in cellulose biosynthesis
VSHSGGVSALNASVITERGALEALVPEWEALADEAANASVFSTPVWQLAWLDSIPVASPRYIIARDDTGRLRALLPLAVRHRRVGAIAVRALELGGEAIACGDHLGFIARAVDATDAWTIAAPVIASCARDVDLVRLASMDEGESGIARAALSRDRSWRACDPRDDVAPRTQLPARGTDVLDAFDAARRKKINYYERHLAAAHPSATIARNEDRMPLAAGLDALAELHSLRWRQRGERGVLADASFMAFVRRFSAAAHARGWLRLYQQFIDDRIVATLLAVHYRGVASGWLLGWNPQFAKWNVSELLWVHAMREAAGEGLHTFDFLRGREAYKLRFPVTEPVLSTAQWAVSGRGRIAMDMSRAGERLLASARRWRTRGERVVKKIRGGTD